MTNKTDTENLINKAAFDVLTLARNVLIVKFRFLDIAVSRLAFVRSDGARLATDGARLIYGPRYVLKCFRSDNDKPVRDYLHVVLHCIFSHMFVGTRVDRRLWDLACDIAVESTMNDLGMQSGAAQSFEIGKLRAEIKLLTAEKIYHYFIETGITDTEIERLSELFLADDHSIWYRSGSDQQTEKDSGAETTDAGGKTADDDGEDTGRPEDMDDEETFKGDPVYISQDYGANMEETEEEISSGRYSAELEEEWKEIAEKVQDALETFFSEQGDAASVMMQNLNEVNRERYDYTAFLKKFSVLGEDMTVNDEEFDYIFYTYGLKLYQNMPLVEPLEYKEVKRIREFVIAVDTSGSTSGELVQKFLQKTYNILKSTESYFSRINIHIIQCDAVIQEHVKITSEEEFDEYIKNMSIHGLGGTDFRPVFDFVDKLVDEGEFMDLKGMIYFTDGYGTFPARKPEYDTAFVFLDNEYNNPAVPPWAIRLVLQNEDI